MSFFTSLLDPLWHEPCSGGIVPINGVVVPALAAAVGFDLPMEVFIVLTPPPAVRPSFTLGVIVVFNVVPILVDILISSPACSVFASSSNGPSKVRIIINAVCCSVHSQSIFVL